MGARPLARLIDELIKKPLADEILFGALEQGGTVSIEIRDNELSLDFSEKKSEPPSKKTELISR